VQLRPYQSDCLTAIREHFRNSSESCIISASTGAGKTIIFATLIQGIYSRVENFRVLILAHRKQLLEQARDKLLTVAPELQEKVGVYSAGLNKREMNSPITIAGIQSVHNRAYDFEPFDLIIIDEVHNFSENDGTTYKKFIENCLSNKNACKVLGFTATPYRMKGGTIYGEDKLFKKLIFKIGTGELIKLGFLCNVTAKHAKASQDFNQVKLTGGDFNKLEVEMLLNKEVLVRETVKEIIELSEGRNKVLIFCCSIKHAELVRDNLGNGVCSITHSKMEKEKRDFNEYSFTNGNRRFMVNVGVLTEGWDCPAVDCIVLLRPTCSPGLYVQMIGRGLRLHDSKSDCLVLDFGGNIERHGAIDLVEEIMEKKKREKIKPRADCQMMKACPECETYIHIASMECLECGYQFPEREFQHDSKAGTGAILSSQIDEPELVEKKITDVMCSVHKKEGKPDSLKVSYQCGLEFISEWICLEHSGYAGKKAIRWWQGMFQAIKLPRKIADLSLSGVSKCLLENLKSISVIKKGKYYEIKEYHLKDFEKKRRQEFDDFYKQEKRRV
jgi:DNA repair protein RadD